MRKKKYKGRCIKLTSNKSDSICRVFDKIGENYLAKLENDSQIKEIRCNVALDGSKYSDYTTDFYLKRADDSIFVREAVTREHLTKPMTVKLLDISRSYWLKRGISDWGVVIDEEK